MQNRVEGRRPSEHQRELGVIIAEDANRVSFGTAVVQDLAVGRTQHSHIARRAPGHPSHDDACGGSALHVCQHVLRLRTGKCC